MIQRLICRYWYREHKWLAFGQVGVGFGLECIRCGHVESNPDF